MTKRTSLGAYLNGSIYQWMVALKRSISDATSYIAGSLLEIENIKNRLAQDIVITATSNGQTTFDVPNGYDVGYLGSIFLNGSKLTPTVDYSATDGSTIVLTAGTAKYVQTDDMLIVERLSASSAQIDVSSQTVIANGGVTARTLTSHFGDILNVLDFGAVPNTETDSSAAFFQTSPTTLYVPPGTYVIGTSGTITAMLSVAPGATIEIADGVTVTFEKTLNASVDQKIFTYGTARTGQVVLANSFVSLGWFDIATDGTVDVGPLMNQLIATAPTNGRTIYIPNNTTYLISTTIDIQGMNYITIRGEGRGIRSNVDYTTPPTWCGGGSRFVLSEDVTIGITDSIPTTTTYSRTSGLRLSDFFMSGYADGTTVQTGIFLRRDSDGAVLQNLGLINFNGGGTNSCCINLHAVDSASVINCWAAESTNCLAVSASKEVEIHGCHMGAQPQGVTVDCTYSYRMNIHGNNFFPDGISVMTWTNVQNSKFSNNVVSSRFTGAIGLTNSSSNVLSDNLFRLPNDTSTDWTDGKSEWSGANYDPLGRDELFGIIMIDSTSNENVINNCAIWSYMDNANACGIRVKTGSYGTRIMNVAFYGSSAFVGSPLLIAIENAADTELTYLYDSCTSTQCTIAGSVVTRFLGTTTST